MPSSVALPMSLLSHFPLRSSSIFLIVAAVALLSPPIGVEGARNLPQLVSSSSSSSSASASSPSPHASHQTHLNTHANTRSGEHSELSADVVVYGGTPGGIMASVAAARRGASVVLIEPTRHVGGMCTNGLGKTDTGNASVIGGLALEFFHRNGKHYNSSAPIFDLEAHVAEAAFLSMLQEAGVRVVYEQVIVGANKSATLGKGGVASSKLVSITTANANATRSIANLVVYVGKVFIDASYEGDLLALAAISYTLGREANTTYNEPLAGRMEYSPKNQFTVRVDPYVSAENKTLLPLVAMCQSPEGPGVPGQADKRIEAFNFRLCLTRNPATRVAISAPAGYNANEYELVRRFVAAIAAQTGAPAKLGDILGNLGPIPGVSKVDCNNGGPLSTDFICGSDEWPEASYERRAELWQEHRRYTQGLLYFLGTDPALPLSLRQDMLTLGLCGDEFVDNGHWPPQLYVREARRMLGETIFTEHTARARVVQPGQVSIGMGGYHFDSHNTQRLVCANDTMHCNPPSSFSPSDPLLSVTDENNEPVSTMQEFLASPATASGYYVLNEGDLQVEIPAFEIPYSVMLPKVEQASNVLVPVALSASHVGFCTLRLEPTWMIIGQAAGVAATMALEGAGCAVQDVDTARLQQLLVAAGQKVHL